MKIVCDSCQAKYSISDDKVQGKVFKIRCKKCSNIIVVRGGAGAAEPAPAAQEKDTRVYDYGYEGGDAAPGGDEAVWHLVINQDQVGPMTVAEVQQRFASGEVDGETFTWREGFADWLPLAQVDAFAALVASGSTTAAVSGGGGASAVSAMFAGGDDGGGTTRSDPGDLFAASSGAARHHDDDGGDLFGSKPAAGGGGAESANAQKLRGERNENSVLFSLNNLAQLASDKPAPSASVVSAPSGHATGAAGGEGSGLIDIRSMASAYLGGSGAAPGKPATPAGVGSIDDLPVFGGGGFSEPAVIVPTARASANNKLLYIMLAAVGGLALVAIILVVVLVRGSKKTVVVAANDKPAATGDKPDDKAAADKPDDKAAAAPTEAAASAAGSAGSAQAAPTETAAATPAPATPAQPDDHADATHEEHHAASHASHHEVVASHETHHEAAHTEHAAPAAPSGGDASGGGGCDEVSCVLNSYAGACCAKFKKGGGGGGGGGHVDSNLPEQLDASMVGSGLGSIRGRVSACGNRSSAKGAVKVHVKVGGSGRVESVSILSSPDGGLGSCVQSAVQHASFPRTQRGGSFNYPFVF